MHVEASDGFCRAFDMDDMVRLTEEKDVTELRSEFLGTDGLDDAPTPVGTPTRITRVEFDFAAE